MIEMYPRLRTTQGVYVIDPTARDWEDGPKPGMRSRPVHRDEEAGTFLGLLAFESGTATGLHQHKAPAFSYFLDGGLTDYQGEAVAGQLGINLAGATHDAIAWRPTLFAARLEGPVIYPRGTTGPQIHAGMRAAEIVNPAPEILPDINLTVDALPAVPTSVARVSRRMLFDYAPVPAETAGAAGRRCVQLQLLPGARCPDFIAGGRIEMFVRGGACLLNGARAAAGSFVIVEPGARVGLHGDYGALVLAWADAPAPWDGVAGADLFGF